MSKGNRTPAKSNQPKLALNLKKKIAHKDAMKGIENRNHTGRVL